MSIRAREKRRFTDDPTGLVENYNLRAKTATQRAIEAAEGGGQVTKEEDDKLTMNAQNISKMVANARSMIDMLTKAGFKGSKLAEAKRCLDRLKLQQYKALAADNRLNYHDKKIPSKGFKQEKRPHQKETKNNDKDVIKLELSSYERRSLFEGLDFEFDKSIAEKKKMLRKQRQKSFDFLQERKQRQM